jgi:murein DD-endopeptidase MepM/ murein hydrolase activator NlpD
MRRLWATAIAAALSLAALTACREAIAEPIRRPARTGDIAIARDSEVFHSVIPDQTNLAALFAQLRIADVEALALIDTIRQVFDPRRLRAGQSYRVDRYFDGRVRELEYEIDNDQRLLVVRQSASATQFAASLREIPKRREIVVVEGRIDGDHSSLIAALDESADGIQLALSLADVFSGDVDFNNDLQPGDTFRLLIEESTRGDGRFGGYGPLLAAELVNSGRRLRAIRFAVPGAKPAYYDEQGRAVKRFFLKSPLKFDPRITSRFSRGRRHPILNYVRAHNGVDYAAATGAPVAAVASGSVTFAGWTSGGGNTVKIRHTGGYDSEYLHLSSIARGVRTGAGVAQGELVGYVGATGLATGPHLHYGLKRNGSYINPVRAHTDMPPGEPIPVSHLTVFNGERERLMRELSASPKVRAAND